MHQFDAHAVGRGHVAQQAAVYAPLQLDRKGYALIAKLGAKGFEIAPVEETEVVDAPRIMAGKVGVGLAETGASPGRRPRMRIVMPPRSTKIWGAPRAIPFAAIVAPNISTYQLAAASASSLMRWT